MSAHTTQAIEIKGTRDGLIVVIGAGSLSGIMELLTTELASKKAFLAGSRIALNVDSRVLRIDQLAELQAIFEDNHTTLWTVLTTAEETRQAARDLGLATRLSGSHTDLNGEALDDTAVSPTPTPDKSAGQNALFLRETLRSGRSILHEGPVVIFGDVNPGAEILAAGDVVVWGRLRGMVHAGAFGDRDAVICALILAPTQLRIADQIAIAPDDRQRTMQPEQAFIRDGRIVAEPWHS